MSRAPARPVPTPGERVIGIVLMAVGAAFEFVRRVRARRFTERKHS